MSKGSHFKGFAAPLPAGRWRCNPEEPLTKHLLLALAFNSRDHLQLIEGCSPLFDLTAVGSRLFSDTDPPGWRPATSQTHSGTAIQFNNQWTARLGRTYLRPFTIVMHAHTDDTTPSDQKGLFQIGAEGGGGGFYIYQHIDGRETLTCGEGSWSHRLDTPNNLIQYKKHCIILRVDEIGRAQIWLDGQSSAWSGVNAETEDSVTEIGRGFAGTYGDSWLGVIYDFFAFDTCLSVGQCWALTNDITRLVVPADPIPIRSTTGALSGTINQATETDEAQALTPSTTITVQLQQATETDEAQTLTPSQGQAIALGQATETDEAQALTPSTTISVALGQATETDEALTIAPTATQIISLNQAAETDEAQALTPATTIDVALGQATETDEAQALTPSLTGAGTINTALETDEALPITPVYDMVQTIQQATEVDLALTMSSGPGPTTDLLQGIPRATVVAGIRGARVVGGIRKATIR